MSPDAELATVDATALAEMIRRRELTPVELVKTAIERIETLNPALNAVVTKCYEQALRDAAAANPVGSIGSSGKPTARPFLGVPILLKDATGMCEGVRLTAGSRALFDNVAAYDSTMVSRLKSAGFIVLGMTSTPEFALLPTTEPLLWGPCRNPWDPSRSPGGSSGGAAAAVAAGMVPVAHASDGGGSIRVPAACCGLFGLKPSRARNPVGPMLTDLSVSSVYEGVLTTSVRDAAAILDVTCGEEPGDPVTAPPPERLFRLETERTPRRLRIAVTTAGMPGSHVFPECAEAVWQAADLCVSLGHMVEEAGPVLDWETLTAAFIGSLCAGPRARIDLVRAATGIDPAPDMFEPLTWAMYESAATYTIADLAAWKSQIGLALRQVGYFMHDERFDLLLTPVTPEPAPRLGRFTIDSAADLGPVLGRVAEMVQFTWIHNATGGPAMSVPFGITTNGLPLAVQFAGKVGAEGLLLGLAAQLERAAPWAGRRPAIHAAGPSPA